MSATTPPVTMRPSLLAARDVHVRFAGLTALGGVELQLRSEEIVGLIGPNGAGKTTFLNVLSAFQKPSDGHVELDGARVAAGRPARLARAGVGRTFQGARLFRALTVRENVELGALADTRSPRVLRRRVDGLLERWGLADVAGARASTLSYGAQRRLGLARALSSSPRFLLLDEPAAGLDEQESDELVEMISGIRDELGCGVLVVEHDMRLIMRLCERLHVLDHGVTLAAGTPAEIRSDPAVIAAYLGTGEEAADARDR